MADSDSGIDIFRNGLAEKFGISEVRVVDGIIFIGSETDGQRKWFLPEQAAQVADQINAFAKAIYAVGGDRTTFAEACELAGVMAEAAMKAKAQRELSKGTGDKTETVQKQLTPLPGHALDWDGRNRKMLEGLVVLGMSLFKSLTEGEIGDVMRMEGVGGERKLGALRIIDQFKSNGRHLAAKQAVDMYDDIKAGRLVLPSGAL